MINTNSIDYIKVLNQNHPVRTYLEENEHIRKIIDDLQIQLAKSDYIAVYNLFNQLSRVDIRYTRKENQLFPFLEKKGWLGPSHGMWTFHDKIRAQIKELRNLIEKHEFQGLESKMAFLISEILRLMEIEEMRLFPISLDILDESDWQKIQIGEVEIGWMHKEPSSSSEHHEQVQYDNEGKGFKLSEGYLNLEQINLLLQVMPFDLTYVDENDKVLFYNRGEERVFPRSAGVIGREVKFCHPPKSVHMVLEILEEFKSGRQSQAEFWIQFKGRVIHIRYFAVRDHKNLYKGVIEVSQDITDIKKIEGEKRLLQWNKEL